ncbi:RNA polymerase sigma factor [Alteribacter aurantiacus]|uniref:RNA polymerase sigma factor n=1 Tax=Alteribacter aurantiacus TaxID=254410 RepID=UPI00041068C8|nr:RNA polymerase sigma factor [Alteribacter aurantiacus]
MDPRDKPSIKETLPSHENDFFEVIIQYQPVVERFARQIGVSEDDLPDVTQDVFIKVYRFFNSYTHGKFTTWLYSITLNVCKDLFRKQKRERYKIKQAKQTVIPLYEETLSHYAILLNENLHELEEKYRIPIVLFYFHDRTLSEIALIMGLNENSVKTRLRRGKNKLKTAMIKGGFENEF